MQARNIRCFLIAQMENNGQDEVIMRSLKKVNEDRQTLSTLWQWEHQRTCHVLRHKFVYVLYEIIKARIING